MKRNYPCHDGMVWYSASFVLSRRVFRGAFFGVIQWLNALDPVGKYVIDHSSLHSISITTFGSQSRPSLDVVIAPCCSGALNASVAVVTKTASRRGMTDYATSAW